MIGTYPQDIIKVQDNSVVNPSNYMNNGPVLLQPFVSDKGIDSAIFDMKSFPKMKADYGFPNMKLHGQAYYNALGASESGAVVKGCRITAKDATYSNLLIKLIITIVESQAIGKDGKPLYIDSNGKETVDPTGNTPLMAQRAKVKLDAETFTDLKTLNDDLETLMKAKYEDKNGTFVYPLYLFASKGRGSYGDNYRIRLTPNKHRDKDTDYRNYTFELLSNEEGLNKLEIPLNITTDPFGKNIYNKSDYIEDVLRRNIYPINMYSVDDYYYDIVSKLLPIIQKNHPDVNEKNIDILFFLDKTNRVQYTNIEIEKDSINLSQFEGIPLQSGSDGAFDKSNPDRWIAIYERYKDFYLGKIDPTVLDIKIHSFHVALDANFPLEVKNVMKSLNIARKNDHMTILDAGIMHTVLDVKSWAQNEIIVDDAHTAIYMHNFMTPDVYTGKDILVTETYIIANELPRFMIARGNSAYEPFAGVDLQINKYIIEGTLRPLITEEDKQELYDLRLNYIEKENNKYIFATEVTTQKKWSALTEMHNVFILHEIVRDVRNLSPYLRFKPNETAEDMKELNRRLNARIEPYADYKVATCTGEIIKSPDPDDYSRIFTKIGVVFKSYTQVNEITIEINRNSN